MAAQALVQNQIGSSRSLDLGAEMAGQICLVDVASGYVLFDSQNFVLVGFLIPGGTNGGDFECWKLRKFFGAFENVFQFFARLAFADQAKIPLTPDGISRNRKKNTSRSAVGQGQGVGADGELVVELKDTARKAWTVRPGGEGIETSTIRGFGCSSVSPCLRERLSFLTVR